MANYVHNYIFCNETAKEKLLSWDYEYIGEFAGCYGQNVIPLEKDRCLVLIDSRGMEYRTECICKFINEFKDTRWYCVEENEIEQGLFWWNGVKVTHTKRKLVYDLGGKELYIKYCDEELRPLLSIFINDKEIVFEKILKNERTRYELSETSSIAINCYMDSILLKETDGHSDYIIPVKNDIDTTLHIYWNNKTVYMESDDDSSNIPNGEALFDELLFFFEAILLNENINERITANQGIVQLLEYQ